MLQKDEKNNNYQQVAFDGQELERAEGQGYTLHNFPGISTNTLPQPDTQLFPQHKRNLLQRIQRDRYILRVQQTIHGRPARSHLGRHLNFGQSFSPHLLLDLEGEHTLGSYCLCPGEHILLPKKIIKSATVMFAFHTFDLPCATL